MSAVLTSAASTAAAPVAPLKVTQARVVRSEWIKFRSLRSTVYTLLVAVVLMIGIGALFSAVTASQYHTFSVADKATFSPISTSLTGISFAVIAFGVLGVLLMSGEYSTGMIRASLTAVPHRLPVLWGKLAVFAGAIFSTALVASFLSFLIGQALLSGHHLSVAITAPGALRSVIGAALYVTVAGHDRGRPGRCCSGNYPRRGDLHLCRGVLRHPAADRAAARLGQRPSDPVPAVQRGCGLVGRNCCHDAERALSPWAGFALLCGYAVILIAAAGWRLRSADA